MLSPLKGGSGLKANPACPGLLLGDSEIW